jgi:DNA invertase Pin-like site-specific DNA recombinase
MKAAIYARVSTHEQDNQNQLAQLRAFAQSQGWEIVSEFCDEVSGAKSDRPAFRAMFEAASKRQFDVLLFWSLDRLSREGVLPTLRYLEQLSSYGVQWRSLQEPWFDSCGAFKDAIISIMATLARQERVRLSERVKAGLQRVRARGTQLGRPRVEVNREQIAALRASGLSWQAVAARLGCARATARRNHTQ